MRRTTDRQRQRIDRALVQTVARLHYVDGLSQIEVARRTKTSAATVSRLLAQARDAGIVRFHVLDPQQSDGRGDALRSALGLSHLRVVESDRAPSLNQAVCGLIGDANLPSGAVIAIGWGRTVEGILSAGLPRLSAADLVPITGGLDRMESHYQVNEFVRSTAERIGGQAHLLYAPMDPGPVLRAQLVEAPSIARVIALWERVDVALVGIGITEGVAPPACGEIAGHLFDRDGAPIGTDGADGRMRMTRAQLSRVPLSIGVAIGADKIDAIIGAARSGLLSALVTDRRTASILEDTFGISAE